MSELNKWERSIVDRLRYGLQHNQSVTLGADEVHIPMNAIIERANRRPLPENKPLTLDELRQMEGEPFVRCGECECYLSSTGKCYCGEYNTPYVNESHFCGYGRRKPERSEG